MSSRRLRFLTCALILGAVRLGGASTFAAQAAAPVLPAIDASHVFNVRDYGAVADGKTLDSEAIRKAIEACAAAGGGRVLLSAGTYLSGPIHILSKVDLHLDAGATVLFTTDKDQYPLAVGNFEGRKTVVCRSPLWADGAQDISITGSGVFDGNGDVWRPVKKEKMTNAQWEHLLSTGGVVTADQRTWYPSDAAMNGVPALNKLRASNTPPNPDDYRSYRDLLRPALVDISNCQRVLFDGPTFRNSPGWNVHPIFCDDLTVRNVTIFDPAYAQNGDGIDIDSCRNVLLTDSTINAGDDAICLKSGKDEEGRRVGRPTEHVTITHCTVGTGHGGITIGSEMSGGVRDVHVSDCTLDGTDGGLRFKTTRGRGGVVEDIHIDNIRMANIHGSAIEFNMYYMNRGKAETQQVTEGTPRFRDFHISNITGSAGAAMTLRGLPEMPIENITIENADITAKSPGAIQFAKHIVLKNVHIHSSGDVPVENSEDVTSESSTGVGQAK